MRWLLPVLIFLLLAACRESTAPEEATALWNELQAANYRANWDTAPGFETRQPSRAAHDEEVQIFVNPVGQAVLEAQSELTEWPVGTIVVKDGYGGDEVSLVAVMRKDETGTAPDSWFWAEYTGDGDVLFSGTPTICTGCHRIGDNFVRGFFFPGGN